MSCVTLRGDSRFARTHAHRRGTRRRWRGHDDARGQLNGRRRCDGAQGGHDSQGQTFSFTFTKAGAYRYHCSIHPKSMTGIVVVKQEQGRQRACRGHGPVRHPCYSVYVDTISPAISLAEYGERRQKVLDSLEGAAAVVFGGTDPGSDYPQGRWKTNRSFWYLTGIEHESGAAVLFDPSAEDPDRRVMLLLRPRDPEVERWDGPRSPLDSALKARTGFASVARSTSLPARLTDAAARTKRLACLHPFTPYTTEPSPDLTVFNKVRDHVPGVTIEDRTQLLPSMRAVKSAAELSLMGRAVSVTAAGFAAAMRFIRPGVYEQAVADVITERFRAEGCEAAFEPIVGSGPNGAVLHYVDLDRTIGEGDLVVIDYAAAYAGYASDVTRTFPASGTFSPAQRRMYEVVLEANLAAMGTAKPGVTMSEVHKAAVRVIRDAGHEDMFIHGIGHQLGIETHDVTPDGPLVPGMVITIEPGIYLPDQGVGIRIEDDIVVTETGNVNLTAGIPKLVDDVEAAMAAR